MSSSLTCVFLFLQTVSVLCKLDISRCPLFLKPSVSRDGDLQLDAFIPLYYLNLQTDMQKYSFLHKPAQRLPEEWDWNNYPYALAFLFAIEEINKDPRLLPNLTLGFNLYNALHFDHKTLENILFCFSGGKRAVPNYDCQEQKKSVAVIIGTRIEFFRDIGPLLELYKTPQVTYGPFDSLLNDKERFSSVYQMATKDNVLVLGVVWLLQHFDWTWVGFFASEGIRGRKFMLELKTLMLKKSICLVFTIMLSSSWIRNENRFIRTKDCQDTSKINVTILYGDAEIFIGIHIWTRTCVLSGMMWVIATGSYVDWYKMKNIIDLFHGSLSFSPKKREVPGFEDFVKTLNPSKYPEDFYIIQLWLDMFNCSFAGSLCGNLKDCPPNSSLEFMPGNMLTMTESSYIIYNAVYAVAQALHEMLLAKTETELTSDANQPTFLSWQLHPFLRRLQVTNSIGDHISLDDKRNIPKKYDILNILPVTAAAHDFLTKVGEFVFSGQNQNLDIHEEIINWPVELEEPPQSVCTQSCGPGFKKVANETNICCFRCVFCPKGEISQQKDVQECTKCSDQEYSNQERTRCLPKLVTYLSFEDSLGMALACTALCFSMLTAGVLWVFVKHQDTPIVKANNRTLSYILLISLLLCFLCSFLFIGHPHPVTCILQQITFGLVFTVALSTVLAKTMVVLLAFKSMKPGRTMRWLLASGASNYVIPICTLVQVVICGMWLGLSPPFIDVDTRSEPGHLLIVCDKGSVTAFYCVLGYLGSLALVSFSLSYLVRNLPDAFNEAKFLTFSMLVFCSVWVTFLPVYHGAQGKLMVALEIFSILASSAGLLVCIFAPKCYIILIRPDKNFSKRNREGKILESSYR
ncbi:vomeronasal type-2 receptor 116-like [Erinaceus europaeus]|uniref:Vomeronasal type-2 receptor 116-like n=1 Tax=Erinaceus europaeus TaxID=9365 RepID=A0ABM3WPC5_ERIEU|nr:vomeronasal type-2 receptor 116-like [Erinaceus europaeus]